MNQSFPFSGRVTPGPKLSWPDQKRLLETQLESADALLIGAGAGLSTAAGFTYSGERFMKYFPDFAQAYGIRDMYSGGFYPFPDDETFWAWWSRNIYINRYVDAPLPVYPDLFALVENKDYFVLTTNVDHQFQRAGFSKERLFYTQGDYGLFQSTDPSIAKTYDNEDAICKMMEAQGFIRDEQGVFQPPASDKLAMRIPSELIPTCPDGRGPVTTNLRVDDSFVQDAGWYRAQARYHGFLEKHEKDRVLYLELGVGMNTPVIIKVPFWKRTLENDRAFFCCINLGEAYCPVELEERSLCIDRDIAEVLRDLSDKRNGDAQ